MKKAAPKASAANLGKKRFCPDCGTKFYDFNKNPISCPKCETELDEADLVPAALKAVPEVKKPVKAVEKTVGDDPLVQSEEAVQDEGDTFESVDDISGGEDEVVEEIEVDDDDEEEDSY